MLEITIMPTLVTASEGAVDRRKARSNPTLVKKIFNF